MNERHSNSNIRTRGLLLGLLTLLVAACGGGGSGDDEEVGFVDTSQPVALNSGNAVPASGLVVNAVVGGLTAGSLGTVVVASAEGSPADGVDLDLVRLTQGVLDRIWTLRLQGALTLADVSPAAQVPPSIPCSGGGAVAANWIDADLDAELSVGDGIILNFNLCVEDGLTLNGEVDVAILELVGDPAVDAAWTVLLRVNYNTLTASESGAVVEVVGTLDVNVDTQASGTVIFDATTEVTTGSGTTASSFLYFGEGEDFTDLSLYSIRFQENADGSFTLSSQGTLESSFIAGTLTFDTVQDITGTDFDVNNPSAGQVSMIGAGGSSVLLRVLNSVVVELDVDDEGDGFDPGDVTITSSWDEIDTAADAL
jgi:hypothetical protein